VVLILDVAALFEGRKQAQLPGRVPAAASAGD
jgi:hypothetical protein